MRPSISVLAFAITAGLGGVACQQQRVHPEMAKAECMQDDQCGDKKICVQLKCVMPDEAIAACGGEARIQFELSTADIPLAEHPGLERLAKCLLQHPRSLVIIHGYADERGPDQRNLMLSYQRANAVKSFLRSEGVLESQVQTAVFGEKHAMCRDKTEECWARNRRAVVISARADKASGRF